MAIGLAALMALVMIGAACSSGPPPTADAPGSSATTSSATTPGPAGTTVGTVPADRPLVGTVWTVETLIDGTGRTPVPAGSGVTLTFPSATEVQWKACNGYSGSVTMTDRTITMGQVQGTLMACPDGVPAEPAMGMVLSGTLSYEIQGDVLRLRNGERGLDLRAG